MKSLVAAVRAHGVPNYFGPQRFGREGSNLRRATAWAGGDVPPRDRSQRSFALSAARSHLFNAVLAARVASGDWNRLLPGEAVMLDGRRSYFIAEPEDAALEARRVAMDVHPSGPLPGRGESPATGIAREVEDSVIAPHAALVALLASERIDYERRSLRLPVRELDWTFDEDDTLVLRFVLPRGTFATAPHDTWRYRFQGPAMTGPGLRTAMSAVKPGPRSRMAIRWRQFVFYFPALSSCHAYKNFHAEDPLRPSRWLK